MTIPSRCVPVTIYSGNGSRWFHPSVLFCLSIPLLALLALSGCGGGTGAVSVSSVSITPSSASVAPGAQADFTATVNLANTTSTSSVSTAVTWEVNGVAGGNSTVGTIISSSTDNQLGIYTAPTVVPSTNNGQVDITAVAQQTNVTGNNTSTTATTITSNTATVTISGATGFSISPNNTTSAAAGQTIQFSATLNGVADGHATWTATSSTSGNAGSINASTGLYTAPLFPPPGNSVTVTGQDGTNSASETFTIRYSDASLTGPYSFSYLGDNQLGFAAVAGSFVADGNGNIESGVEDIASFQTGVTSEVAISGNYVVGSDGRGSVNLTNGTTWRFALAANQHALILHSDVTSTGSGTMDQQNLNSLTNSNGVVSGSYVFTGSGADSSFRPLAMAGKFTANGAGSIPVSNNILDLNDGGAVTQADTSLTGSYAFDPAFPGTGRGTLTLTSTSAGSRQYAFYTVDSTHLRLVEIDHNGYFVGDAFSSPAGSSFSPASISGNYVFTAGGNSGAGAYAAAGLFTPNGAGTMTGGAFDANNAGTLQNNVSLTSCAYSVDPATGRVDLKLCGAGTSEFAVYPTSENSAVMLEIDSTAITGGTAYLQQSPPTTAPSGNFAFALAGQGIFHSAPASYQQDVDGQFVLSTGSFSSGNLDINNFNSVFTSDKVNTASVTSGSTTTPESSIAAPAANGRGTATITGANPVVSYKLVYYLVSPNTALMLDQDSGLILNGVLTLQY